MKKLFFTSALIVAGTLSAQASVLFSETFDYPVAGTGTGPGSALAELEAAGYSGNGGGGYSIVDNVFTGSPEANPLGYEDNSLTLFSGRTISDTDRLNGITSSVDTTFYFSYTFRYDDAATVTELRMNSAGRLLRPRVDNDHFFVSVNATAGSTVAVTHDTDYFVIGKFRVEQVGVNNRTFSIDASIFSAADIGTVPSSEPLTWDSSAASFNRPDSDGTIDGLSFLTSGGTSYFESFRIGSTYESLVVPEPTSAAFLIGASTLVLMRRRRR